jgi:hypothetical protein
MVDAMSRRLVIALALTIAACSSSGGGGDPGVGTATTASGPTTTGTPAPEGIEGVVLEPAGSRDHVEGDVAYPKLPPSGGPHNAAWLNCGFYDQPMPEEHVVHSLEHGAVWIAYNAATVPAADLDAVHELARQHPYLVVTPYPGLQSAYVLLAWERRLQLDSFADPRFLQFIATYEQGPQTPEPGARCDGAVGTPI